MELHYLPSMARIRAPTSGCESSRAVRPPVNPYCHGFKPLSINPLMTEAGTFFLFLAMNDTNQAVGTDTVSPSTRNWCPATGRSPVFSTA